MKVSEVINKYNFGSDVVNVEQYGSGRINRTFIVECENGKKYILQAVNTNIFKDVDGLMGNIVKVSNFLSEKYQARNESDDFVLKVFPTAEGKTYTEIDGKVFRVLNFIENSACFDDARTPEQMRELGRIIGKFHSDFQNFDASQLATTIPNFHNTQKRYSKFMASVSNPASLERASIARKDILALVERKAYANLIVSAIKEGSVPARVTHNDPKFNNIMFDATTGEARGLVDWDTIMPDSLLSDVGDAIRSACNTAGEEERDLSKVGFNKEFYKAFMEGYIPEMAEAMTDKEKELLPYAPLCLTDELAIRFLDDYLNMDEYFGVINEDDNLNRSRVQFALLKDMENNFEFMKETVETILEEQSQLQ